MQNLINDLLAYSRVGNKEKEFVITDCEKVLESVLQDARASVEESGAVVTHDPLPILSVDASQLRQVFQNLVSNAIQFRNAKPPHIHISAGGRSAVDFFLCRIWDRYRSQAWRTDLCHFSAVAQQGEVSWDRDRAGSGQEDDRAARGKDLGGVEAGGGSDILLHDSSLKNQWEASHEQRQK